MLRFIRAYYTGAESRFVYYIKNAVFISAYKRNREGFTPTVSGATYKAPVVFDNAIAIDVPAITSRPGRYFECVIYADENQPVSESIEELTANGISLQVFNEYGVMVCDNGISPPASSASSDPVSGNAPGEMTSVPGEEPGEMASETTDEPGAMI